MNCPKCNITLLMTDRHGVEIDYCPQCRGIWLDRGELDKIIEKSSGIGERNDHRSEHRPMYGESMHNRNKYHDDDHKSDHYYDRRRKKGFLGELFDF